MSDPVPSRTNRGLAPGTGTVVDPGHSAILLSPPSDAAVQMSGPPTPIAVESAFTSRALRLSAGQMQAEGLTRRLLDVARARPPSNSPHPQTPTVEQQRDSRRLLEAVRDLRGSMERVPNLPASLELELADGSSSTTDRRRAAAPTVVDFQRRVPPRARTAFTASSFPPQPLVPVVDVPSPHHPVRQRVRYNADGEEIAPVGTRAASATLSMPRPTPQRAVTQDTVVVAEPSEGEGDSVANLRARIARADTVLTALRNSPGIATHRQFEDTTGAENASVADSGEEDHESEVHRMLRDVQLSVARHDNPWMRTEPPIPLSRRMTAASYPSQAAPYPLQLESSVRDSAAATTAWRTRMEFLTSTVNLPLSEQVPVEPSVPSPPALPVVDDKSIFHHTEDLVPCPLPQPLEEITASDDSDDEGYRSALTPNVVYW